MSFGRNCAGNDSQPRGLPLMAAATAFGTSGWKTLGMMKAG